VKLSDFTDKEYIKLLKEKLKIEMYEDPKTTEQACKELMKHNDKR